MRAILSRWPLMALASMLLFTPVAWGTTVMEMNLAALTERSEKIFRGTVLDVSETSVQAGGGTPDKIIEECRRSMRVAQMREVDRLEQNLAMLATIGSTHSWGCEACLKAYAKPR